ncbi:hypothetical protein [Caulobacter segnis]|uniref:Uncharacterized protein n=1 Tax=Caulobacter segnis (strain ATCC 21756 / DSM 7131 / JCM 7823 / NBRC 15250 / LMG 17158 / TK0059) TaxID=509190 RepID=D5VPI5_CAUST|nr:hypothetical protein [Caulobacter segnis]ADG12408.1 hypothetical protein Cseg_3992 [Caulobacter segnis ATCC 21756]
MVDVEISFSPTDMALSAPDSRLAPLAGLGLAMLASLGLWGLLAWGVSSLL